MASFSVEDFGSQPLERVTLDDVRQRYETMRTMVAIEPAD
jgi:hypothetical protein